LTLGEALLLALGIVVGLYAGLIVLLVLLGRGGQARALARFVPDCAILFRRLVADPRVPRRQKLLLALLFAYLASPIDLIPDFIPGIGQLDDAALVALTLRSIVRSAGPVVIRENWPGPPETLRAVLRLAAA
jgi:uncharacterized membrane protein YkvA (DUF1232 family)